MTIRTLFVLLLAVTLSPACKPKAAQYAPPPPPEVTVAKPVTRDVTEYAEFTGTTEAHVHVEIRARVSGFLEEIAYQEGAHVKKGDLLFRIDPKPYEADLRLAQAEVRSRQADLGLAETTLKRLEVALEKDAVSKLQVEEAEGHRDVAKAAVEAAEATARKAELDLGYTEIRSPVDGWTGRSTRKVGDLVGYGEATLLTTVVNDETIHAWFDVSESVVLAAAEAGAGGRREPTESRPGRPVQMGLSNEAGYPHEGHLDYTDPTMDRETGTLLARASFPNPKREIFGGLFVRLRIPLEVRKGALLVPEVALGSDQAGRFVLVVNAEDVVERRDVTLGSRSEGMRVVLEGLTGDERVIVNGLMRARPGAEVRPRSAEQ